MRSTNTIIQHALESAKIGGNLRQVTRTEKPKRKAANARPAVVLNVRPPSNPTKNGTRKTIYTLAAAIIATTAFCGEIYQPDGWAEAVVEPIACLVFGNMSYVVSIGSDGLIDYDKLDEGIIEKMKESADFKAAFYALESALQSKEMIKTLPPLDTAHTTTISCGDYIYLADVSRAYSNGTDYADNHRFCAKPTEQSGNGNCAKAAAQNYLNFANAYSGGKIATAKANGAGGRGPSTTPQALAAYLKANTNLMQVDVIPGSAKFGDPAKNAGEVCAIVKMLVSNYGGFLASVAATCEWLTLKPEFRPLWKGREMTISGNEKVAGPHATLVFGYDDNYVYIQNSWGEDWGYEGCAKIEWYEFAREFHCATVVTDAAGFKKMLEGVNVKNRLHVKGLGTYTGANK